jgi:formamidopyrimidine-DNA glycosylase
MPELPEVETVRRGIAPVLEGARFLKVQARRKDLRIPIPDDFSFELTGKKIIKVGRRSKYILIHIEDGPVVILHLGMSGKVTLYKLDEGATPEIGKHDHLIFETDGGMRMIYTDPRRFGLVTFADPDKLDEHPLLASMGPEPLSNSFHSDYLMEKLAKRKSPIKNVLLDQKIIAGLGNIYVCEALFRAHINPERHAATLNKREVEALVPIINDIIREAIAAGGSSLKDYAQVDGELGYFQHQFQAYGREDQACINQGCGGTIDRIAQSGRSTFYCKRCQL